jgi:hypothetical protein
MERRRGYIDDVLAVFPVGHFPKKETRFVLVNRIKVSDPLRFTLSNQIPGRLSQTEPQLPNKSSFLDFSSFF